MVRLDTSPIGREPGTSLPTDAVGEDGPPRGGVTHGTGRTAGPQRAVNCRGCAGCAAGRVRGRTPAPSVEWEWALPRESTDREDAMPNPGAEAETVRQLAAAYSRLTEQIGRVIVGQSEVVEQLLMALFSRGHCLLVGVPGL